MALKPLGQPAPETVASAADPLPPPVVEEVPTPVEVMTEDEEAIVIPDPRISLVQEWLWRCEEEGPAPTQMHFGLYLSGRIADLLESLDGRPAQD